MCVSEELSIFVRKDDYSSRARAIKETRFYPRRGPTGKLEVSLCRSSGIKEVELWCICNEHVYSSPKPAIGRGRSQAQRVYLARLTLHGDGVPFPRHANIEGWVDDGTDPKLQKHNWMNQAQQLVAAFEFVARPTA